MKVVVTGASGFVGRELVNYLRHSHGIDVVPVSRSNTYDGMHIVENYEETPHGDVLVHLAEDADRVRVNAAGNEYHEESKQLLKSLIEKQYGTIIYGSTAVLYGDKSQLAYHEHSPVKSTDNYSSAKLENEESVLETGGIVVRFSNIIGPHMANNNVLSDVLAQISGNDPVKVRDEQPVRDFVWIGDVARGIVALIRKQTPGAYNIGSGVGISIRQLVEIVLKHAGQSGRGIISLKTSKEVSSNVLDISKIFNEVKWKPLIDIDDAIKMLLSDRYSEKSGNINE